MVTYIRRLVIKKLQAMHYYLHMRSWLGLSEGVMSHLRVKIDHVCITTVWICQDSVFVV